MAPYSAALVRHEATHNGIVGTVYVYDAHGRLTFTASLHIAYRTLIRLLNEVEEAKADAEQDRLF